MVANNAFLLKELKEKGKIKGKIEVAKNLLDILDDKTIARKTGLEIEIVMALRKEFFKKDKK